MDMQDRPVDPSDLMVTIKAQYYLFCPTWLRNTLGSLQSTKFGTLLAQPPSPYPPRYA